MASAPKFVIARRPQADVAISGRQLRFRRKYPIIRPSTARFPRRFAPRNDKPVCPAPMNLCCKTYSLHGAQGTPLQTQSVHTVLTAAGTDCKCLPEIATGAKRPRNDKSGAGAAFTVACIDRCCSAGPGCPRPLQRAAGSPIVSHFQYALYALNLHFSPG